MLAMPANADNQAEPNKAIVWPGSVFASIAHAIFVARAPMLAHEQSWNGRDYSVHGDDGLRGTIAFGESNCSFVGVFFSPESDRNPLRRGMLDPKTVWDWLTAVPSSLVPLAKRASQYVLQDVAGVVVPIITTAFWSDPNGPGIKGLRPWGDILAGGGELVWRQLLPIDLASRQWGQDFELSQREILLARTICERRLLNQNGMVFLTSLEASEIRGRGTVDGNRACEESFMEIGIGFPSEEQS